MKILLTKIFKLMLVIITLGALVGCQNNQTIKTVTTDDGHVIITIKEGQDIVINTSEITSNATYYNYQMGDTIIQIFAVKASDGTIRVAYNTCGACNPAPDSYFIQDGEYFECQNCGNRYHIDEIGFENKYGCSPIAILDENKKVDKDTITIASDFIETYQEKFESINIYEN